MLIDEFVQEEVAATNGVHFAKEIHNLTKYPIPEIPLPVAEDKLLLDIGCGWGRWLVASANKKYIPVGIDLWHKFASASKRVLESHGKKGYVVVADLKDIPFKNNCFDQVWSFSVIQHVHKSYMLQCLKHINRLLADNGNVKLEFPNRGGLRNRFGPVQKERPYWDDYDHMAVRYYSVMEYRTMFMEEFGNFDFENHSFLGIGVLKDDLKHLHGKTKLKVLGSLMLSEMTNIVPGMKYLSDSIYINAQKEGHPNMCYDASLFVDRHHELFHNLNIVSLLQCPKSKGDVYLSKNRQWIISERGGVKYPVVDEIPVMKISEAVKL